jgi:AraC-like DNA-binding protein
VPRRLTASQECSKIPAKIGSSSPTTFGAFCKNIGVFCYLLAGSRPEISAVARELGLSDRTLQRRIIDDGATFRQLLLEARQELAHEYLNRPEMDVTEVAFLLGYEDSNSFYRAFRTWEGTTPSQLRAALRRSEKRKKKGRSL